MNMKDPGQTKNRWRRSFGKALLTATHRISNLSLSSRTTGNRSLGAFPSFQAFPSLVSKIRARAMAVVRRERQVCTDDEAFRKHSRATSIFTKTSHQYEKTRQGPSVRSVCTCYCPFHASFFFLHTVSSYTLRCLSFPLLRFYFGRLNTMPGLVEKFGFRTEMLPDPPKPMCIYLAPLIIMECIVHSWELKRTTSWAGLDAGPEIRRVIDPPNRYFRQSTLEMMCEPVGQTIRWMKEAFYALVHVVPEGPAMSQGTYENCSRYLECCSVTSNGRKFPRTLRSHVPSLSLLLTFTKLCL